MTRSGLGPRATGHAVALGGATHILQQQDCTSGFRVCSTEVAARSLQVAIARYLLVEPDLAKIRLQAVEDRPYEGVSGGQLHHDGAGESQSFGVVFEPQTEQLVHKPRLVGDGLNRVSGHVSAAGCSGVLKGLGQPGRGDLAEISGDAQTSHATLRAKRTLCSIGLGSVKYMTPPSFAPSAGIRSRPMPAKRPSTSSAS